MKRPLDLVITGLPRSGTSFLCSRINSYRNTAIINEPSEVFQAMKADTVTGLQAVFSQYRADIGADKPVYNKIKDGKFIEDTRLEDSRALHQHIIDDEFFTLGIKNTLVFMSVLPDLARSKRFPKVIASIRHPYDCVASWHSVSFPHLRESKPAFLREYAAASFRKGLDELLVESDLVLRSAMLWQLLAQTLLAAKGRVFVLRYEDMVKDPVTAHTKIGDYLGLSEPHSEGLVASAPVRRREQLSDRQKQKISDVCAKLASQFGYRI